MDRHTLQLTTSAAARISRSHPATTGTVPGMGTDILLSTSRRTSGTDRTGQMIGRQRAGVGRCPTPASLLSSSPDVSPPSLNYKREETRPEGSRGIPDEMLSLSTRSAHSDRTDTHEHTHWSSRDLGPPFPLSLACNPYCKLECKSTRAQTGRRDVLSEPI